MLFHYSVPGFICRKERSSGFDQRKNKGRRRSLFQRPPSIILSSFSALLHPTLKLKDQETSCVGCIKTEVSGTFSLHCICLSPADAYSMKKELQQTFRIQSVWCTALANSSLSKLNFCKRKVRITFTNTTGWSMIQRWIFFSRASSQAALMRPLKLTAYCLFSTIVLSKTPRGIFHQQLIVCSCQKSG